MGVERTRTTAQATAEGLRVFVAGIPFYLAEDTLRRDFEECGVVEDVFLLRDDAGKSRGRAFITFRESAAVEAALAFDDTDYGGRKISVKIAEARRRDQQKEKGAEAGEGKKGKAKVAAEPASKEFPVAKPEGCRSLCLKNIGSASETHIRKFLEGCRMQSVRLVTDRTTGAPRGIAFVDFKSPQDVDRAMDRNGQELRGNKVEMHYEAPRERPRPENCMSVAIKKLPPQTAEPDVRRLFNGLKSLKDVRIIMKDRQCTGLAFAEFDDAADVEAAILRDGMKVKGEVVFICYETRGRKEAPEDDKRMQKKPREKQKAPKQSKPGRGAKQDPQEADEAEEADADASEPEAGDAGGAPAEAPGGRKQERRRKERAKKKDRAKQAKAAEAEAATPADAAGAAGPGAARKKRKRKASDPPVAEADALEAEAGGPKKKKRRKSQ